jgi:hypothetical protein
MFPSVLLLCKGHTFGVLIAFDVNGVQFQYRAKISAWKKEKDAERSCQRRPSSRLSFMVNIEIECSQLWKHGHSRKAKGEIASMALGMC